METKTLIITMCGAILLFTIGMHLAPTENRLKEKQLALEIVQAEATHDAELARQRALKEAEVQRGITARYELALQHRKEVMQCREQEAAKENNQRLFNVWGFESTLLTLCGDFTKASGQ